MTETIPQCKRAAMSGPRRAEYTAAPRPYRLAFTRRRFRPAVDVLTFVRPSWAVRLLLRIVRMRYGR
ncbi:MAG TPA: hypothetical protein VHH34_01000 [Pseudonocardiaceae bacterium]|nr:hypothetical protein [Pseudonocardiaceae bacterium]